MWCPSVGSIYLYIFVNLPHISSNLDLSRLQIYINICVFMLINYPKIDLNISELYMFYVRDASL